jgi:hypothetical protein
MSEAETMATSVPYTMLRVRGWNKNEENRYRYAWERARLVAHTGLPYEAKKNVRRPIDFIRFPWEDGYRNMSDKISNADMQALKEKLNQEAVNFFNEPPPVLN